MEGWYETFVLMKMKQDEILKEVKQIRIARDLLNRQKLLHHGKQRGIIWWLRKLLSRVLSKSGKLFIDAGSNLEKYSARVYCAALKRDKGAA